MRANRGSVTRNRRNVTAKIVTVTQAEAEAEAEERKEKEPPNPLKGEGVRKRFEEWKKFRRGLGKKPKDWNTMFHKQALWLCDFTEQTQLAILDQSMRNGWQGLFELKNGTKKAERVTYVPRYMPEKPELTDEEFARQQKIVREGSEAFRKALNGNRKENTGS
jgi:hypothetical protein